MAQFNKKAHVNFCNVESLFNVNKLLHLDLYISVFADGGQRIRPALTRAIVPSLLVAPCFRVKGNAIHGRRLHIVLDLTIAQAASLFIIIRSWQENSEFSDFPEISRADLLYVRNTKNSGLGFVSFKKKNVGNVMEISLDCTKSLLKLSEKKSSILRP